MTLADEYQLPDVSALCELFVRLRGALHRERRRHGNVDQAVEREP
jgi:hypothetical protein